jgi:hypothetical protein
MMLSKPQTGNVRWRSVALPIERGGWGFISEPILVGLLLAPSWGGLALSCAAFAVFLLRQPLKIYLKDVRNGRQVPRTIAAQQFVLIYGGIAFAAGVVMFVVLPRLDALLPLLVALPFVLMQLAADVQNRSRSLWAELAGAVATGAVASTIVMMREWSFVLALGLWLALAVKAITAVLYVRARLRLEHGKPAAGRLAVAAHIIGFVMLIATTVYHLLPWTAPVAMGMLLARAVVGLSPLRKARPPKIIGMQEMGYGLLFVLLLAFGYTLLGSI